MSAPLEWAPLLTGRKLNERTDAHSDSYGILASIVCFQCLPSTSSQIVRQIEDIQKAVLTEEF